MSKKTFYRIVQFFRKKPAYIPILLLLLYGLCALANYLLLLFTPMPAEGSALPEVAIRLPHPDQYNPSTLPVYDAGELGIRPIAPVELLPEVPTFRDSFGLEQRNLDGQNPTIAYLPLTKEGPGAAAPGTIIDYTITLANFEAETRTFTLDDTLPQELEYIPGSADGLLYDPAGRRLYWRGELEGGNLDYTIAESPTAIPYLDLGDFGAENLCTTFIDAGQDCNTALVTFNLGTGGYAADFYGRRYYQVTLSADGLLLPGNPAEHGSPLTTFNQRLPDPAAPSGLLAGLWRDVDMTTAGRWHAAVISGLIEGHDVFYAQWHDAPQTGQPDLTARQAILLVLASENAPAGDNDPLAGAAFYLYDNISDPDLLVAVGYTIGIEDPIGSRGLTHAYAPCCQGNPPPQGYPPPAGTTLILRPFLFNAGSDYSRTFHYQARVLGQPPETLVNTALVSSDSPDPGLATLWDSHYLAVRHLTFLPLTASLENVQ